MKTVILILLCLILLTSSSLADFMRIKAGEKDQIEIDSKYNRLRGIILIGASIYFAYVANRLSKGARFEAGDINTVSTLFAISSVPLFVWGVKLTF